MNLKNFTRSAGVLVLLFLTVDAGAESSAATSQEKLRLAGMRAMLFYQTNGNFSADVFTGQVNLWNTVIEGASREGASESMLVVVQVDGESNLGSRPKSVELVARYRIADQSGRGIPAFFKKSLRIYPGTDKKFFAAFWLYQTGCHPVDLTARIVGQTQRLRKTINLGRGE
ncbi:MAG TPA: hypothetical protein VJT71_15260 [Pyrinomonadaceae bacterium]|nr:hypothetical protein [Pyrinomonadaceae bacterium]